MSRIGKQPVVIPAGVKVAVDQDNVVTVEGPKGKLSQKVAKSITVSVEEGQAVLTRQDDTKENRALHGLYRVLVNNMVVGVSQGFNKSLTIVGTGYRAQLNGKKLGLAMGFSHPVEIAPPAGIAFEVPQPTTINVVGIDKQQVGQVAAQIRSIRPPEPYLGKGIRYTNENVRRKAGKAAK